MKRSERDQLRALVGELMEQQTRFAREFPATDTLLLADASRKIADLAVQTIIQMETTQRIYAALQEAEVDGD